MPGWPWPSLTIWLCIGTATATVKAQGEKWGKKRAWNMAMLDVTIVFAWLGFYVVLLLYYIPRTRPALLRFIETGKLW